MRGTHRGGGEAENAENGAESRRLTPSIGLAHDSDRPNPAANEDFLFHLYRGSELLQDNRAHEAKEELERALHLQPNDTKGQDLLAVVYFRLGLYPRAIAIYEQLRRESPRDTSLLLNLALCYLKTGQPALARRSLEQLVAVNPTHARAWGYLGLACERAGDIAEAQRAFEQGGHAQMARRMADRRASMNPAPPIPEESVPSREVRDVVATAYEELDAGELSFELAEPASDSTEGKGPDSWRPVELGQGVRSNDQTPRSLGNAPQSSAPSANHGNGNGTANGDAAGLPHVGKPPGIRRPTLIVGVPPAHAPTEIEALSRLPSPRPPPFELDEAGAPSLRTRGRAVVVPGTNTRPNDDYAADGPPSKHTLPPPPPSPPSSPPLPSVHAPASVAPPAAAELTRTSTVAFPAIGNVVIHPSGVALVRTTGEAGFAARLEAMRASSNGLGMKILERQQKGKTTGESFGGVGSPIARASGEGQLVLAPRSGRKLSSFALHDDMCFVREEVLLGFDGELGYENGRLATGDGESVAVVQLKGRGAVLLEAIGEILTLEVHNHRGLSVRREVILGWFGRLVPRALATNEAPGGQRGLVSFAGEGRVLVASA